MRKKSKKKKKKEPFEKVYVGAVHAKKVALTKKELERANKRYHKLKVRAGGY